MSKSEKRAKDWTLIRLYFPRSLAERLIQAVPIARSRGKRRDVEAAK